MTDKSINRVSKITIIALLYLFLVPSNCYASNEWHMINVNYGNTAGDAHLLIVGDETVMIDAGTKLQANAALIPYLKALRINRINHFFISHPHGDHYGGLTSLLENNIFIEKLYYKVPTSTVSGYNQVKFFSLLSKIRPTGTEMIQPATGFTLDLPNHSSIKIIHAQEGNLGNKTVDINDLSLIMKWRIESFDVLFTGDLNRTVGKYLATNPRIKADILKMPHHGHSALAPNSFLNAVNPSAVLVPGPAWTWCGDRAKRARKWTINKGIPVWVNGIDGHVIVHFEQRKATITPQTPRSKCKSANYGVLRLEK